MPNFNTLKTQYITQRQNELKLISKVELGEMHTITFNLNTLTTDGERKRLLNELEPIMNLNQVLYYLEMSNSSLNEKILQKAASVKKKKKPKLPKLNSEPTDKTTLYVGKTAKSGFGKRMIQHLGYSASLTTYALHLARWATKFDLEITLYYLQPNLKGHPELLEEVESILHLGLKPLMGRSGH